MELPLVVPKTRTKNIGAARATSETVTFGIDATKQGFADVHAILVDTIATTTAEQIALGNNPNFYLIDGRQNKPVDSVYRKGEVFFGAFLPRALMSTVELELHRAITNSQSSDPYDASRRKGSLADIRASWHWVYINQGKRTPLGGPTDLKTFQAGDLLILTPTLKYAGRVNSLVAQKRARGYLLDAVDKLRRKPVFRAFQVTCGFSKEHMLPDEVMSRTQGTPFIQIRMQRVKYRKAVP